MITNFQKMKTDKSIPFWLVPQVFGTNVRPPIWDPPTAPQVRLMVNLGLARGRRAKRRARRALRMIKKQMSDPDGAAFHEEVARTLVEYVGDRFNRAPSGLTYELADELLAGRGIDESARRRFRSCLETCDFARFVPSSSKAERRAEVLNEAVALIDTLERAW